jgi:hypothetical protein
MITLLAKFVRLYGMRLSSFAGPACPCLIRINQKQLGNSATRQLTTSSKMKILTGYPSGTKMGENKVKMYRVRTGEKKLVRSRNRSGGAVIG